MLPRRPPARTVARGRTGYVAAVAVTAIAAAAVFAWANTRYAAWVTLLFDSDNQRTDGLLFSALLFTLAVAVASSMPSCSA